MKKLLLVTSLLIASLMVSAQKNTAQSYIDKFKE
ncbi:MAG: hypothetical protein JWP44_632, partial [Mucilaginibacter sp.]|nr:hypothetical protein [Mucilaginibacter sp.]